MSKTELLERREQGARDERLANGEKTTSVRDTSLVKSIECEDMQIKLFTIPVGDSGTALEEMNRFLRTNKILEVHDQLISNGNGAYWCFCVRYIERTLSQAINDKRKVDYRKVLDDETFKKFSRLREIRKKVAADEGIPAFAVFTDEELSGLAKLDTITEKNMLSVKGIGDKKVERFSKYFITNSVNSETSGTVDRKNS